MTQAPTPGPLWMMHVIGPDDIYPAPDHANAVEWCAALNASMPASDVLCVAVPAIWTGTPEAHAEGLSEAVEGWTSPRKSLAPTAPVEASGSELHPATADLVDRFAAELKSKLAKAESKYGYRDEWLKPDWQDELTKSLAEHIQKGDPRDVAAYCAFAWHHEWSVTPNINWKAEWEAVCSARIADRDRSQEIINERDAWIAELLQQAKVTTPARAEAQDEGAAGEPVAWAKAVAELEIAEEAYRKVMDGSLTGIPLARYAALQKAVFGIASVWSAHPSPTPAADADRVRIAVEAFNAKINAPLTGPTHGAWDRGRIAGLKEALAALKSTAAKEGGE